MFVTYILPAHGKIESDVIRRFYEHEVNLSLKRNFPFPRLGIKPTISSWDSMREEL